MNYYERYCGDYQRDTAHLSLCEHGAFTMLLDTYYSTENPLPSDYGSLYRICRAMDKAEQAAVRSVVDQFFPIGDDGCRHNNRADDMIGKARPKIEAARVNGKKGGRPRKSGNPKQTQEEPTGKPTGFDLGNPAETQSESSPAPTPTPTPLKPTGDSQHVGTPHVRARPAELSAAMRRNSIEAQPGDPRVIAAAEQGVTVETVEAACAEAKSAKPGQRINAGYVLTIAERWTRDAAAPRPAATARGSPQRSYHDDRADVIAQLTGRKPAHQTKTDGVIDVNATPRRLGT